MLKSLLKKSQPLLYEPLTSSTPTTSTKEVTLSPSITIDKLTETLPNNYKIFSNSINESYYFWKYNFVILSKKEKKKLGNLILSSIFLEIPIIQDIILDYENEKLINLILNNITIILKYLVNSNLSKLILKLKKISINDNYNIINFIFNSNIKNKIILAFHQSMTKIFCQKYTFIVRGSFERIYYCIGNIIHNRKYDIKNDKLNISDKQFLNIFNNLESTLKNIHSREYLRLYMYSNSYINEQILEFYIDYLKFKSNLFLIDKLNKAKYIINTYILQNSIKKINISYKIREYTKKNYNNIINKFKFNNNNNNNNINIDTDLINNLFDKVYIEQYKLLLNNIFPKFKKCIKQQIIGIVDTHNHHTCNNNKSTQRKTLIQVNLSITDLVNMECTIDTPI